VNALFEALEAADTDRDGLLSVEDTEEYRRGAR
jgi:hypothetical protein